MQTIDDENMQDSYVEYVEDEQPEGLGGMMHHGGKNVVYIVSYMLFLAVLMFPAQKLHMGEQGVFFAMVGAGLLLCLGILLVKSIRRKIRNARLTRKGFAQLMVGYTPEQVEDNSYQEETASFVQAATYPGTGRELIPAGTRKLAQIEDETLDEPPATIIEQDGLYLSNSFCPSIHSILGTIILVCGNRRFGKSNLIAVMAEEMAPYLLPLLIIDTADEYSSLTDRRYMPRGFLAGSPALQDVQLTPLRNFMPITTANAYVRGREILEHSLQVVLNMKSYDTDEEAALVLCELVRGMDAWEQERPNTSTDPRGRRRIPVWLMMDEAPKWLPEDRSQSSVSKETQSRLNRTFFGTVVNRGGKNGFGCVFAAQRIQDIAKPALQAPWKFLFYQGQKVDLEQYATFGLTDQDTLTLRRGECYIFSPSVIGFRTFMRERSSQHMGHTPGLEALKAHQAATLRPVQTLDFRLPVMHEQQAFPTSERYAYGYQGSRDTEQRATSMLPEMEALRRIDEPRSIAPAQNAPRETDLDRALRAYDEGHTTIDALAVALNMTPWTVRPLYAQVKKTRGQAVS